MNSTASALWYLRLTSLRNIVVTRVMRLKQPKYLFGAIVGIAYFYFAFFRQFKFHSARFATAATTPIGIEEMYFSSYATTSSLFLTIVIMLYWIWPRARAALTFSEAEIAFLFPAPIARTTLIHYRLCMVLAGSIISSLIFTMFSSNSGVMPGAAPMRFIGWWVILTVLGLHAIASSFVTTRLLDRGITTLRRQITVAAILVAVVSLLGAWTWHVIPAPDSHDVVSLNTLKQYFIELFNTAPLSWLLFPAKLVVMPAFAPTAGTFLFALLPAALIIGLHYAWVLRAQVAFEEASIVKAEKRAAKLAEIRAGKVRFGNSKVTSKPAPFNLNLIRRPEIAFLWKNLLATASYLRGRTFMVTLIMVIVGCQWLSNGQHEFTRRMVEIISSVFAGYVLLLGPMVARQDLRNDLANTDILKTYPLRGWQIILGEISTPVTVLSVIFCLFLLAASLTLELEKIKWMTPVIHWCGTIVIAILGILLCTMQVMMLNASALLFPAWTQNSQGGPGGVEVMGQRLLFTAGLMLVFAIALLPAALFAALIYWLTSLFHIQILSAALACITLIAIMIVEVIFGLEWLGEKFEQFDLSAELRA